MGSNSWLREARNGCHFHGIAWDFDAGRFTTLSGLVIVTA
jgi:hypothetical protein